MCNAQKGIADVRARILRGFSLMEMMVVLLIVAIIAAASAPMVTKKLSRNTGTGDSPWVFTGLENSIAYNMNESNSSAIIGASTVEDMPAGLERPRLFLNGDNTHPALAFGENGRYVSHIIVDGERNTITFNDAAVGRNSTAIGLSQNELAGGFIPESAIAIGAYANAHSFTTVVGTTAVASGQGSVAIGNGAYAQGPASIAISPYFEYVGPENFATKDEDGTLTKAEGSEALAIGGRARSIGTQSIAIGTMSHANSVNTVSIGFSSEANGNSGIAIGCRALSNNNSGRGIAIGNYATATGAKSVAIGSDTVDNRNGNYTRATEENAIAIGPDARATGAHSVALGASSRAKAENSAAIGAGVSVDQPGQIKIGGPDHTVYIPGNLVVDGNVALAASTARNGRVFIRTWGSWYSGHKLSFIEFDTESRQVKVKGEGWADNKSFDHGVMPGYFSDKRLKNLGRKYTAGLAELKKLDFFHFTFKQDEEKTPHVGVIAQDLQKVFPDAVTKGEDGYLRIRWEDMFYAVINAVKELDNKITEIVQNITDINSTIEKQNQTISEQAKIIEEQNTRLEELEELNGKQTKMLETQSRDIDNLIKRIEKLEGK